MTLSLSDLASLHRGAFHALTVGAIEPVAADAIAISLRVPSELRDNFRYEPGQHLTLRANLHGTEVRRTYSICSTPSSGGLRVGVRRVPGGALSQHLFEVVRPGDRLDVMEPAGRFTLPLDGEARRSYVAIAAGSGITPILALVAAALEVEPESRVTLFYGNRTVESAMFLDDLADVKDRYPARFQLLHVFSRQRQQLDLHNGRLDAQRVRLLVDRCLDPDRVAAWMLCGPYPMIQELTPVLAALGVPKERIKTELFFVEDEAPVRSREEQVAIAQAGEVSVRARLNGRETQFSMRRTQKLVESLAEVRPDAPYSCKGGVCGTCRARLTEGRVAMDHTYALDESDRTGGYILTCQSHPLTDTVAVDYDA